ncbi:hypothetical protein DV738_g5453, partial [Chaetothyriales sp. CBS 135597]
MAASAKPLSTYTIARGDDSEPLRLVIHNPDLRSENLNLTTWGSSYVLAQALHTIHIDRTVFEAAGDIHIIELGAGTGLVGLSASVIWKANVLLTDLPGIVPGLALNIAANKDELVSAGTKAYCATLDWRRPAELVVDPAQNQVFFTAPSPRAVPLDHSTTKVPVILVADCIYDPDHPEMLIDVILARLLPGDKSWLVIAYPLRVAYLDAIRDMWERLELSGLESVQTGRADAGDEFDDESLIEWAVFKWKKYTTTIN